MKKVIAIVMVAAMAVIACMAFVGCGQSGKTLYVYTEAGFAPFEYVNAKGDVVGVDVDVMNYIGKKLGYKVVISSIDFDLILTEVQKSEYAVGAAGMSKREDRDLIALASDIYATSVQYVIAPNGTFADNAVVSQDEILAKASKIGVQKGTTGFYLFDDYITALNEDDDDTNDVTNQLIQYANAIVGSQDIGKSVQVVIIDELPAKSIAAANNALSCWQIDAEPESYVYYFNKNATELVKQVNEILAQMKQDGTIDQYIINHSNGN